MVVYQVFDHKNLGASTELSFGRDLSHFWKNQLLIRNAKQPKSLSRLMFCVRTFWTNTAVFGLQDITGMTPSAHAA